MAYQADNISAGTQVVSLVEVRGTHNSLVHPRGAMGAVTRTPRGRALPSAVGVQDEIARQLGAVDARLVALAALFTSRLHYLLTARLRPPEFPKAN